MENKDDLISRRAALDIVAKDNGMAGTYDQIESLPGQMTAEEAWEIARRICCDPKDGGLLNDELQEVFGGVFFTCILHDFTPGEAKAKIEAWENRLKVGDVVEYALNKKKGVVVADCNPNSGLCHILFQGGISFGCLVEHLRKTGKTIDIQSVLEQLGE